MNLIITGLNHKTASLEREQFTLTYQSATEQNCTLRFWAERVIWFCRLQMNNLR